MAALEWYAQNGDDAEAALLAHELAGRCHQQIDSMKQANEQLSFTQLFSSTLSLRCQQIIMHSLTEFIQNDSEAHDTIFLIEAQHLLHNAWKAPDTLQIAPATSVEPEHKAKKM
jgi:hypothetical protein